MPGGPYRVVQPWGKDRGRQATILSEHATVADPFRAIEVQKAQMRRTGAPTDTIRACS